MVGNCSTLTGWRTISPGMGDHTTPLHAPIALPLSVMTTLGASGMAGGIVGGPAPDVHAMSKLVSPTLMDDLIACPSSVIVQAGALPCCIALVASNCKSDMSISARAWGLPPVEEGFADVEELEPVSCIVRCAGCTKSTAPIFKHPDI